MMSEMQLVLLDPMASMREICTIWPEESICLPGSIEESKTYIFEFRNPSDPLNVHLFIDEQRLKRDILDNPVRIQWEWSVEFYAGEVEIMLQIDSHQRPVRKILITDPDRRKLTREQFDAMVQQILRDTFALLSLSSFKFRISRGDTSQIPAIARLEFLRSQIDQLDIVVRAIDRNPVRVLRSTMDSIPFQKSHQFTSSELIRSLTRGKIIHSSAMKDRLPKSLEGRIPEKIYKARKTLGLDIREHRDIKAALKFWSSWLTLIADKLTVTRSDDREQKTQQKKWASRCHLMSQKLNMLLKLPLFNEVQDSRQPVYSTQIYQRIPLYGQFLTIYNNFQQGIANIVGDFLQVPLARTYDLYEVWTFLRLAQAATILFPDTNFNPDVLFATDGRTITVSLGATCFDFGGQFRLCFQKTYKEFWLEEDGKGTYSRYMRPDFALEIFNKSASTGPGILIILDAKYRVEAGLNEALSSIHMYKDALVQMEGDKYSDIKKIVTGAYLVTPDLPTLNTDWQSLKMPARLFHPEYRSNFRFGAVTMQPGITDDEVVSLLRMIIADCTRESTKTTLE
jgi:hypothetical protein